MPLKSFGKISETWYIFITARNNIMKFLSSKNNTFGIWLWDFFSFFSRGTGTGETKHHFQRSHVNFRIGKDFFSLRFSCVTCFSHRSVLLEIVVTRFVRNILWGVAPPACTLACYKGWGQGLPRHCECWGIFTLVGNLFRKILTRSTFATDHFPLIQKLPWNWECCGSV